MSLNEQQQILMINILCVNDTTVKPKISKLSYTPTISSCCTSFKAKSVLKQFTAEDNFNLQWFHCSSVTPV